MNPIQKNILRRQEIEEMSTRELLMELVQEKRREETLRIIGYMLRGALVLAVILVLIKFGPQIIAFFKGMSDTINSISQTVHKIDEAIDKFGGMIGGLSDIFS